MTLPRGDASKSGTPDRPGRRPLARTAPGATPATCRSSLTRLPRPSRALQTSYRPRSRTRLLLALLGASTLAATGSANAANISQYAATVLRPGLARLQVLDSASNRPCAQLSYRRCAAALRKEAVAARELRAQLSSPPSALAKPVAALRSGLGALAATLDSAALAGDRQRTTLTPGFTRRFDLAFQRMNSAILALNGALPPGRRLPTFLP
jgi:hypothetical protein